MGRTAARREADLDFHGAVVEAAHNSLLSHVSALIRIALEAADFAVNGDDGGARQVAELRAESSERSATVTARHPRRRCVRSSSTIGQRIAKE